MRLHLSWTLDILFFGDVAKSLRNRVEMWRPIIPYYADVKVKSLFMMYEFYINSDTSQSRNLDIICCTFNKQKINKVNLMKIMNGHCCQLELKVYCWPAGQVRSKTLLKLLCFN